jgi:uncharacterized protein YegP (UPF0339 family)
MKVKVFHGKLRWFWHLVARNGEILAHSQGYYSKSNAIRAANKLTNGLQEDGSRVATEIED